MPTILVVGTVHGLEGLQGLGQLERSRWSGLLASAARWGPGLVVVGHSAAGVEAASAIALLKDTPATRPIPVLHAAPPEVACPGCRADVCMPAGARLGQLARVAGVLLELHRSKAHEQPARPPAGSERQESLGQLAAGIVHDVNNLLGATMGQIELARRALDSGHPAAARLASALQAGERAAALTRQLLSLGRASPPEPALLDLGAVVAQLDGMLRCVIGEEVAVEIRSGRALGRVRAHRTEVEQLLLNLAVNARDAMPGGGRLTIETRDLRIGDGDTPSPAAPPGRHVVLAVSDEGVGIDPATRKHIFEPFFTTKAEGAGSGIGLATVHGVVERIGGSIAVDSEPGLGTTFRVCLPCAEEDGGPVLRARRSAGDGGS